MALSLIPRWLQDPGLRKLYFGLCLSLLSGAYQGFDQSIMSGLQILPAWEKDLNYPSGPVLGLMNSIANVGAVLALPFIPIILDAFGRRNTLVFGASWTLVGSVIQGSSFTIAQFTVSRFLIGVGLAFTTVAAPLLLVELALPRHRGTIMGLFPTVYYIGSITSSWTAYGTQNIQNGWSWRIPSLMQAAPAIFQILLIYFTPESPRWLVSKNKGAEAKRILVKYHANGDENDSLVALEYEEIKHAILSQNELKARTSWKDLYSTPGNRRRLTIVFFAGVFIEVSGTGLTSTYIHSILSSIGYTETRTQTIINGCISIYKFVLAVLASSFVERIGRRPLFIISTAGMLVSFILWTALSALYSEYGGSGYAKGVLVCIFFVNGFYSIGWTPLWSYPSEILSYETRARGVTFQTGVLHVFGFFVTFVNPIGLDSGWKYYIAYVVYTCLELLCVCWIFVETRGYTLEQISLIFDTPGLTWKQRRNMRGTGDLQAQTVAYIGSSEGHDSDLQAESLETKPQAVSTAVAV